MSTRFQDVLDRLAKLLTKEPLTALQISARTGCCKPAAYQRVQALKARGEAVYELPGESDRPGPAPIAYGIR